VNNGRVTGGEVAPLSSGLSDCGLSSHGKGAMALSVRICRRRPAEAQCTRSLGLGYKLCTVVTDAGQRTHGTTFRALKATFQVAGPGAESATVDPSPTLRALSAFRGVPSFRQTDSLALRRSATITAAVGRSFQNLWRVL